MRNEKYHHIIINQWNYSDYLGYQQQVEKTLNSINEQEVEIYSIHQDYNHNEPRHGHTISILLRKKDELDSEIMEKYSPKKQSLLSRIFCLHRVWK